MARLPPSTPRWARGDVGREIGKWILAEITELLALAGIHGRNIDAGHIVGVVPTAASKIAVYIAGVLCNEQSGLNLTDNFQCAPNTDPYFTGVQSSDVDLSDTGVVAGVYGDADFYPVITIDAKGRVTSAGEVASGGGGGGSISVTHEEFTPANAATTVTLATAPGTVLAVARNGVVQSSAQGHYSLATNVLTFTTAFDGTEHVVVAYTHGAGAGPAVLNDLDDVTLTSPATDHILTYDSYTSQWVNTALSAELVLYAAYVTDLIVTDTDGSVLSDDDGNVLLE